MIQDSVSVRRAREYARGWDIDLYRGLSPSGLMPVLMPMDDHGRAIIHLKQEDGVDYYFSRIDYFDRHYRVAASRRIYLILPGYRNHSVYLPAEGRIKIVEVHRGHGFLMMSSPPAQESDDFSTAIYQLNPVVTPAVTVTPDNFYAFEAATWNKEPLVISELVMHKQTVASPCVEIRLEPHQETVKTSRGRVEVPADFYAGSFR